MRHVLPLLMLMAPLCHGGEPSLDLTLASAVHRALAKNFQIKAEEFTPQVAKARQLSASGKFDPLLELSATYDNNQQELRTLNTDLDTPTITPGDPTPDLFANRTGTEFDSSITGVLPWGLIYDVGGSATRNTDSTASHDTYNSFYGVSITQPLLKNFGTDVNLADIRIARADRSISQWQLRQKVIDVVTETITTYCELYFSIENLSVEERSRGLARQLLEDNKKRTEIGVMSPLDVVQAESDLAAREERVLVAQRAVLDNENFLKQLVTDEVSGVLATRVHIAAPPPLLEARPDRERDFARAFELRPDYRQALLDLQKRHINVVFTRNQALPRLDLVSSFGVNGIDTNFNRSLSRASGSGNRNLAWDIGGVFSVPIPNRDARGQLEVSKLETARALVELKRLEQSILVEADNSAGQIETTRKRIEATRTALGFAEKTLEAAQARLASGTTTTFEVLQFQRDLATAQISEVRARTDHIKAVADYARSTGRTLEKYRINLE